MLIRPVSFAELPAILGLIEEFDRQVSPRPDVDQLKRIFDQITEGGGAVLGAELYGCIVGTCTITLSPNLSWSGRPYAMIENVIVSRQYRGQGIGKALLREAQNHAQNAGCYKVGLMTGSKKPSTLKFYESSGFVTETKTPTI